MEKGYVEVYTTRELIEKLRTPDTEDIVDDILRRLDKLGEDCETETEYLSEQIEELENEVSRLEKLLNDSGIEYNPEAEPNKYKY